MISTQRFLSILVISALTQSCMDRACVSDAFASSCSATNIFSLDAVRQVFALLGQSNMQGRGTTAIADQDVEFPNRGDVYVYDNNGPIGVPNGTTNPAAEPVDSNAGQAAVFPESEDTVNGNGPALAFADELLETWTNHEIGLIPCALGGTEVSEWAEGQPLYEECESRWQQDRIGITAEMAGILIYQGESDTQDSTEANSWVAAWVDIVEAIRANIGRPFLPVLFIRLPVTQAEPAGSFTEWALLRTNMHRVCDEIRWCTMVQAPSGPYIDTNVHLDTTAQISLGRSIADAYETIPGYFGEVTP